MDDRLEVRPAQVRSISSVQDIIDVVQQAMEALQPEPTYPADDKQLIFDELASVLDFFGAEY